MNSESYLTPNAIVNFMNHRPKSYDQPRQCINKSRDITLPTKVQLLKAMAFPVGMYGCGS